MKVPGIEEIWRTFDKGASMGLRGLDDDVRKKTEIAGLLAVFETHVKGMLAQAWLQCVTKIDCSFTAFDEHDANEYADRAIAQLKEPRHD